MKFPPSRTMKQKLVLIAAVITLAQCGVPDASGQWVQTNGPYGPYGGDVTCLAVSGGNIFEGGEGVYLSTDSGKSWTKESNGLNNNSFYALATMGTNIFAGTDSGVFRSKDNGKSWTKGSG